MRYLASIVVTVFFSLAVYSQEVVNSNDAGGEGSSSTGSAIPAGYGEAAWGSYLSDTRERIAGRLVFTDDKNIIISRDGDLEYHYGFFYRDPLITGEKIQETEEVVSEGANEIAADTETVKDEGRLFYVALRFPYLDRDLVYNKIKEKYGPHSSEDIRNNQGAMAWNSDKTIMLMWIDRYENKPYCRRIVYINKDMIKELNEYHYTIFNKREIELIKQLNP